MGKNKNNENEFCARCGVDLFRPGVEPVERDGKVYCVVCAGKAEAQDTAPFDDCGPMANQLKADFKKLGIPLRETLAHYGAPLYFGYIEKNGRYFVQEPAERSSGMVNLFMGSDGQKFRWFLLHHIVRVWADGEERRRSAELQAAWKWPVAYDPGIPEKELELQKLSLVFPPESDEMQTFADRVLTQLNRDKAEIVRWVLDPDTMTLYMPAEKHHAARNLWAEQQKLEDQLKKRTVPLGGAVMRKRLEEIRIEGLFIDAGPDMAAALLQDAVKLELNYKQVRRAAPECMGHSAAGYWAEGVEEEKGQRFVYPVCRQVSAEEFRWIMRKRMVQSGFNWQQLHPFVQHSIHIQHLLELCGSEDPYLQAYIQENIEHLEKRYPDYDWEYKSNSHWLSGTPKAGKEVPGLPRPGMHVDASGSRSLFLYGDISGHGDQISAGSILSGPLAGKYYWSVVDDGYPNRMAGGGFTALLPDGLVRDGRVTQQELFRWIRESWWPHAKYLVPDENDRVILDLLRCEKVYAQDVRVSKAGLRWVVSNGGAVILGCEGAPEELEIPKNLDGYYVHEIVADAFCNVPLKKIIMPHWIARIGARSIGYERGEVHSPGEEKNWEQVRIVNAQGDKVGYRKLSPPTVICARNYSPAQRYAKANDLPTEMVPRKRDVEIDGYLSEEAKHWHGVSGGSTAAGTQVYAKSNHFDDFEPVPATPPQPAKKTKNDWAMIGMACFFGIMGVISFFAKGWLLGAVFVVIAVLMPVSVYLDRKKEEQRKERLNKMRRNRQK